MEALIVTPSFSFRPFFIGTVAQSTQCRPSLGNRSISGPATKSTETRKTTPRYETRLSRLFRDALYSPYDGKQRNWLVKSYALARSPPTKHRWTEILAGERKYKTTPRSKRNQWLSTPALHLHTDRWHWMLCCVPLLFGPLEFGRQRLRSLCSRRHPCQIHFSLVKFWFETHRITGLILLCFNKIIFYNLIAPFEYYWLVL